MDTSLSLPHGTAPAANAMWRHDGFVKAAGLQIAQNHIRRALDALDVVPPSKPIAKDAARALAQQRARLSDQLMQMGAPSITALIALKVDIDQRHPVSVDLGLALCSLGSARIARIQTELTRSLTDLRTADIAVLLQACARLGWDREIDRSISALRPGAECELGEALAWRIQREPWRISDHTADWADQLRRAHQFATQAEAQMMGRPRLDLTRSQQDRDEASPQGELVPEAAFHRMR